MNTRRLLRQLICLTVSLWLLAGCSLPPPAPIPPPATATQTTASTPTVSPAGTPRSDGLSAEQAATLSSLRRVDDYPLYTMRYHGAYEARRSSFEDPLAPSEEWSCSLFAALGDAENMLYGRNFDWDDSPALLLFTDPPDGYAAVSLVDIAYLGFGGARAHSLPDLSLAERRSLLDAPFWPFDGLNERGLAVGMAAVPPGQMVPDAGKETIGSLQAIREMLDHAADVDEAVTILESHNVDMGGGPPIHYLIADRSGRAALVEFYGGEMVVIPQEAPWHQATNFLRAAAGPSAAGQCWRYDRISQRLTEAAGRLTAPQAMQLLAEVAQGSTQWSVVYAMSRGEVHVVMGRQYEQPHIFPLDTAGPTCFPDEAPSSLIARRATCGIMSSAEKGGSIALDRGSYLLASIRR